MSDRPQGEGWWLASDGKWYPPESRPAPPPAPVPPWAPPAARLSPGLHTSVRVFLYLTAGATGLAVIALAYAIPKMYDWWTAPVGADADEWEAWQSASRLWGGAGAIAGLAGMVLFILLLVWGSQAYRSLAPTGAGGRSWSPGWAVGGWFLPLANALIPRLVFSEIERIAHPDNGPAPIGDRWRRQPLIGTGLGAWILTVAGGVVGIAGAVIMAAATETSGSGADMLTTVTNGELYRNGLVVLAASLALAAVGQLLGAAYFRSLGERLLR